MLSLKNWKGKNLNIPVSNRKLGYDLSNIKMLDAFFIIPFFPSRNWNSRAGLELGRQGRGFLVQTRFQNSLPRRRLGRCTVFIIRKQGRRAVLSLSLALLPRSPPPPSTCNGYQSRYTFLHRDVLVEFTVPVVHTLVAAVFMYLFHLKVVAIPGRKCSKRMMVERKQARPWGLGWSTDESRPSKPARMFKCELLWFWKCFFGGQSLKSFYSCFVQRPEDVGRTRGMGGRRLSLMHRSLSTRSDVVLLALVHWFTPFGCSYSLSILPFCWYASSKVSF